MNYPLYNQQGEKVKEVVLNPAIFEVVGNVGLVHQVVVAQSNNSRQVLAHTKDRSEVSGGGIKPWKQKGTGRARHGSIRSPIWVGGGVTFGPTKDRNFTQKINKKMKRKALLMCLSDRAQDQSLVLVDSLDMEDNKTKNFVAVLENLKDVLKLKNITKKTMKGEPAKETKQAKKFDIKDYKKSVLVIAGANTAKISRAARIIPGVTVLGANSLNVIDILKHKNLLATEDSLPVIEATYLK
jgi:large subunit ribosomal protein L4